MPDFSSIEPMDVLRVLCGLWFIPHVLGKIQNFGPAQGTFEKAGMRPPKLFLVIAIVSELAGAAGLIFNVYPQVAAVLLVNVLLGASYAVVKINGFNWRWQKQGPEYMLFWSAAILLSVA